MYKLGLRSGLSYLLPYYRVDERMIVQRAFYRDYS